MNSSNVSKSSYLEPPTAEELTKMKVVSAPELPNPEDEEEASFRPQLSAPSYLHHLRENESPPFSKPELEPRPHILTGTIMNEEEAVAMIAAADADKENGLKKFIGNFLIEKNMVLNYALPEKNFLISLIMETIDYAAQRDFDAFKLAVLITIYLDSHLYFKWYYWQSPTALWNYFKEVMIRHTIETRNNNLWITQRVVPCGNRIRDTLRASQLPSHRAKRAVRFAQSNIN
ncbi:unnamed protein product [Spodoptera exigua]|nr:unnamed protein product [Spodoptera exigua]